MTTQKKINKEIKNKEAAIKLANEIAEGKTTTFDNIAADNRELDIPVGNSEQVLGLSYFQNTGKAIADNDIYPAGEYLLRKTPEFEIWVVKQNKIDYTFITKVYDWAIESYHKELDDKKKIAALDGGRKLVYDFPEWVLFELVMNLGVHPMDDEKKFEQALWDYFPDCWIDTDKAPKRWSNSK